MFKTSPLLVQAVVLFSLCETVKDIRVTSYNLKPFVDADHFVHKYFLTQQYAILIPVSAGVELLCFLSIFIGFMMLKSKRKAA